MLGTLAGIALVWIAVIPCAMIFENPIIGLPALFVVLIGLVGFYRLPLGIPAGLFAILIGVILAFFTGDATIDTSSVSFYPPVPILGDLIEGVSYVFAHPEILAIVLPVEIYNFIETMNNVGSANSLCRCCGHCIFSDGTDPRGRRRVCSYPPCGGCAQETDRRNSQPGSRAGQNNARANDKISGESAYSSCGIWASFPWGDRDRPYRWEINQGDYL